MKKTLLTSAVALSTLLLAACATKTEEAAPAAAPATSQTAPAPQQQPAPAQAQQKAIQPEKIIEVNYRCDASGQKQAVTAHYAVVNGQLAAAQLQTNGSVSPVLERDMNAVNADSTNVYSGGGFSWITDLATAQNVTKVNGNMLMKADGQILLKSCDVVKPAKSKKAKAKK